MMYGAIFKSQKKKSREKKVSNYKKIQKTVNKMAILSPYLPINYLNKWTKFSSQKIQNLFQETRKISNKH